MMAMLAQGQGLANKDTLRQWQWEMIQLVQSVSIHREGENKPRTIYDMDIPVRLYNILETNFYHGRHTDMLEKFTLQHCFDNGLSYQTFVACQGTGRLSLTKLEDLCQKEGFTLPMK